MTVTAKPTKKISVIDSHTGGEPTRVVLSGLAEDDLDIYRSAIIGEPRGHDVLVGALLVPPKNPGTVARVVFFNNVGRLGMCGHGMIGVLVTLEYLGRIAAGVHRIETPVGDITATLHSDGQVSIRNVVSYRRAKGVTLGPVTGDVAYGGNHFLLVSDHGMELTQKNIPQLTRASLSLRDAVRTAGFPEVDHVELFGPAEGADNDSRSFVLCPGGAYDRSPCGTGTSAKLACLAADGMLLPGEVWRQESIIGSVFEGHYETTDAGIVPTITGQAFVTSEATLILDEGDPFRDGIRCSRPRYDP